MQTTNEQEVVESLTRRAVELWGSERAKQMETNLRLTARQISKLASDLPPPNEEPGFYF